ncbi:type III secretion system export apparatus subunit SctS [Escherichia marmotae]|nr:type III secretion system export apparatus subunit SctS [Escherichia marmotae]MED9360022.1 type III secretion system export apparatus subunit SctS [Escherichia marmotae]
MSDIISSTDRLFILVLVICAAPVLIAIIVGILIGLIQTVTQIQEQTLPFGVKLLCVGLTLYLLSGWMGNLVLDYSRQLLMIALK